VSAILTETCKRSLIVFVKPPIPGEVKTKLIPSLSGSEAAELYKCFVADTLTNIHHVSHHPRIQVAYQPHSKASNLDWLGLKNPPEIFRQEGRTLGERLVHAFGVSFGHGSQQVVIIGSDSPHLPVGYIEQAFHALDESDIVVGPSNDGGYYLIGLSRPCMRLFEEVIWTGDQVFERATQNALTFGYTLKILPSYYDIDTIEDLKTLHLDLQLEGEKAPQTRKYLHFLNKQKPLFSAV